MTDKETATRLDPGILHPGIGSIGLGATDEEVLAMYDDPDHVAFMREVFADMDDTEFEALLRSTEYEMRRPFDAEEELEDDDEA